MSSDIVDKASPDDRGGWFDELLASGQQVALSNLSPSERRCHRSSFFWGM